MAALLYALLICSATWASTVSARSTTPVSDDGQHPVTPESDFIDVTCTPVETEGEVDCFPSIHLRNAVKQYFMTVDRPDKVTCGVDLHLPPYNLKNECQEVANNPSFIRCTATIPRHLKHIAYCNKIGADPISPSQFLSHSVCYGECAVYSHGIGCVIDEGCRLCMEDLRKYLPQHSIYTFQCELGI
ncbi:uncharacterized protein LOC143027651 [Oratosquilla oratoria]|uniref:uncharacterized protein LOC143027651 n=1 Tax=Oratosquilla oratoria TaxID=337810 RepID=UPI003F76C4F2